MDRLRFSRRARRRWRRRRALIAAWFLSLILALFGISVPNLGLELLGRLDQQEAQPVTASSVETSEHATAHSRFSRALFEARPQPPPPERAEEPAAAPASGDTVTGAIYAAAAEFGLEGDYLLAVASCESGLDPGAVNAAGYYGLFQFDEATWSAYGYGSIYDPVAQARTAARLLAAGESSRWPNCA